MSNRKGHLFVVSGPSGTGKSSIIEKFLKEDGRSRFSVSCTTRPRREHELDGRDYRFVGEEEFRAMVARGEFLEYENVHGHFYGTPVREVSGPLSEGIDVILDIDVKGALAVKENWPDAVLIFVDTRTQDELVRRLTARGEKEIEKRMQRVREEVAKKGLFTYVVINDTLDNAYGAFASLVAGVRRQQDGQDNR
ncbi:MAG: guanylate kinase [Syntrophorhabdales bacterium]|jgi:guanylate kinase